MRKIFEASSQVVLNPPKKNTGLTHMLSDWWRDKHRVFLEDEQEPAQAQGVFRPKLCCTLNFCICSGRGRLAWDFHTNVAALLRPHFRAKKKVKPPGRFLLDDAALVLRLESSFSPDNVDMIDPFDPEPVDVQPAGAVWLHLSYINLTSFVFTVLPLTWAAEDQGRHTLLLKPDANFEVDALAWSKRVDFQYRWEMTLFEICANRPKSVHVCVSLSSLAACPLRSTWPYVPIDSRPYSHLHPCLQERHPGAGLR